MKPKSVLKEYISRLIRQTLVQVTGVVGLVVTAVLGIFFSGVFIEWAVYLIILVAGLVAGSYFVFADLIKEFEHKRVEYEHIISELELKIREFEDTQPHIIVGFQDESRHLTRTLQLQLRPLPPKPDFDALVEERCKQLPASQRSHQPSHGLAAAIVEAALGKLNPRYEEEIEQYPRQYRAYLVRRYERDIAPDRTRPLIPIVKNQGSHSASNVTIEFEMPKEYKRLAKHQSLESFLTEEELEEPGFTKEGLRELEDEHICGLPPEPQRYVSLSLHASLWPTVPPPSLSQELSNTSGPVHDERDGVHYIVYNIDQLVQHRPEDNFDPFFAWLGDIKHSTTWEIPVSITSADLRKPQKDTLLIEIRVEDTQADYQLAGVS